MRWQLTLADAATGLGDVPNRGVHASNALTLAGRRLPRTPAAATLTGTVVLAARGVRRLFAKARAPGSSSDPTIGYLTRAYRQMAVVSFFANEPLRILYFAAQALVARRARRSPTESSRARWRRSAPGSGSPAWDRWRATTSIRRSSAPASRAIARPRRT